MPIYAALVPVVEANQWYKNGDHPEDRTIHGINDGRVVQRVKLKNQVEQDLICSDCKQPMNQHGFINRQLQFKTPEYRSHMYTCCPGDYIQTHRGENGRVIGYSTYKKALFESNYGLYKEPIS